MGAFTQNKLFNHSGTDSQQNSTTVTPTSYNPSIGRGGDYIQSPTMVSGQGLAPSQINMPIPSMALGGGSGPKQTPPTQVNPAPVGIPITPNNPTISMNQMGQQQLQQAIASQGNVPKTGSNPSSGYGGKNNGPAVPNSASNGVGNFIATPFSGASGGASGAVAPK